MAESGVNCGVYGMGRVLCCIKSSYKTEKDSFFYLHFSIDGYFGKIRRISCTSYSKRVDHGNRCRMHSNQPTNLSGRSDLRVKKAI